MKTFSFIFLVGLLTSCTSNTIYKKPENLIPRDTMVVLIEDLIIASSSKSSKNKEGKNNVNYLPLVKEKYKIDSARFAESNLYYVSKIDLYLEMLNEVQENIEVKKKRFENIKIKKDSLAIDSLKQIHKRKLDTIILTKDSLKIDSLKLIFEDELLLLEEKLATLDIL